MNYTEKQRAAIDTKSDTVLVSAAAGSGKTSVLAKRVARLVKDGADIRRMLVMTFTNAAAAEMRRRIARELYEAAARTDDRRVLEQAELTDVADISTFHSFCAKVVRDHYDIAGAAPNFRIMDETEAAMLRVRALREYFDVLYERQDADFLRLLARYTRRANDAQLVKGLLRVYENMMGQPAPYEWVLQTADMPEDVCISRMKSEYAAMLMEKLEDALELMRSAQGIAAQCHAGQAVADAAVVKELEGMLECAKRDITVAKQSYAGLKIPPMARGVDDVAKAGLQSLRKDARAGLKDFLEDAVYEAFGETVREELRHTLRDVRTVVEVIRVFEKMYAVKKTERNTLDYEDLQHKALRVLREAGGEYAGAYDHVFVDEYQDTNPVQEEIIRLVHDGNCLFMVGDVKQSIYRFRLADPGIFRNRAALYRDDAQRGEMILMNDNFRSAAGVIEAVNFVMECVMCERLGEIEYDDGERLMGRLPGGHARVLLCEAEEAPDDDTEEAAADSPQAEMIANSIGAALQEPAGTDGGGGQAGIQYGDIAILMRSRSRLAGDIKRALDARGIPCVISMKEAKDTVEVELFINLLRLVENPAQDIPLLSVMRSFIGGFDEADFAEIRLHDNDAKTPFSTVLAAYAAQAGTALARRAGAFLRELEALAEIYEAEALDAFLQYLAERYDFYAYTMSVDNGNQKMELFEALVRQMESMTEYAGNSLYRLLEMLDEIKKREGGYVQPTGQSPEADCVRIMTIHGAKGLEFPVVYIAGLERRFNVRELSDDFLTHGGHGLSVAYVDEAEHLKYETVERRLLKEKIAAENKSEELRMLYVGMTRAKQRLYLTGQVKSVARARERWEALAGRYHKANCMLDWIMAANHNAGKLAVEIADGGGKRKEKAQAFDFGEYRQAVCAAYAPTELVGVAAREKIPAKVSVSAVKKSEHKGIRSFLSPQVDEDEITGAHLGTLVHGVMERLVKNGGGFDAVARQLAEDELISQREYEALLENRALAESFLESGLYARLRRSAKVLFEQQFNMRVNAREVGFETDGPMVVQGILDAAFMEDGKWILLDYKTDRVDAQTVAAAAEGYRVQIDLYARALEQITRTPVTGRYLYFLRLGREIEL